MSKVTKPLKTYMKALFNNREGKVVIWQYPNLPLLIWICLKIISLFVHSPELKADISSISQLFLFAWAYLELKDGANLFRKGLGISVITLIVFSYQK